MVKRRAQEEEKDALRFFQTHGFVLVPSFLTPQELQALQQESAALYEHVQAADASERIVEQGCVLDVMADCPISDASRARVDQTLYLAARTTQFALASGKMAPVSASVEQSVIARLLFKRLPSFAAALLASAPPDACAEKKRSSEEILFFNEHYVVKPPQTAVEFRWHRDDDEQLGMCLHRASIPPYISAWCALDDITSENGALRFVPLSVQDALDPSRSSCNGGFSRDDAALNATASAPLLAKVGSVVFFLSNVWHCSSCNDSDSARRAFYAQYSRSVITAMPNDPSPLSFAIPCVVSSDERSSKRARKMQPSSPEKKQRHRTRGPD